MAWCISNQETTEVVTLLFESIKQRSPDTPIRVLMTDDGKQLRKYMYMYVYRISSTRGPGLYFLLQNFCPGLYTRLAVFY